MELTSRLTPEETAAVARALENFVRTWNAKDLEQFETVFHPEAEFTDVVGQTAIGREAVVEQHRFPFNVVMKEAVLELREGYARALSDDLVMVSGKWKVTGSLTPQGKPLPDRHGVIQFILKKEAGDYVILLVHNADNALPYDRRDSFIQKSR